MKTLLLFSFICFNVGIAFAQITPYEKNGKNYTATYGECIDFYKTLDKKYNCISIKEMGMTDAGIPLHVILISKTGRNNPETWRHDNKVVILINNGIHPGEPDGIDACMMLTRDLAESVETNESKLPENVALAIIPVYNIGGCLNRSEYNRVDQNGPEAFGSRGNSQNLDLNRDFIKCDSKEARSFAEIFHWIEPDVFMDTHVSDGADYQHVMTLAGTQHNKLGSEMGNYLNDIFEPALFGKMKQKGLPMIPYVNVWGKDARDGWGQFFDAPRYSSGYTSLFNTFSFTVETHMLKPYNQRVNATYKLIETMIDYCANHADTLKKIRRKQVESVYQQKTFPLSWKHDEDKYTEINFSGYPYKTRVSKVSELPVHFYERNEPYTEKVKFYNTYSPLTSVEAPDAYVIPQGWWKVIELLRLNQVEMIQFEDDQQIEVESYTIKNYKSSETPYEGHHTNNSVEVDKKAITIHVKQGDYYIPLHQKAKRFIVEVLEPLAGDSYFTWNFFDPILIQKEGYSDYAYEDYAAEYLTQHPEVQNLLNEKRNTDTAFAHNASDQLYFVYQHSPYPEKGYMSYPVYRVMNEIKTENKLIHIEGKSGIKNKEDE